VNTRGKKKKRTSKENVDGRCTSSHEKKTFRRRSVAKQKEMVFGFRKTATAVTRPERRIDRPLSTVNFITYTAQKTRKKFIYVLFS